MNKDLVALQSKSLLHINIFCVFKRHKMFDLVIFPKTIKFMAELKKQSIVNYEAPLWTKVKSTA